MKSLASFILRGVGQAILVTTGTGVLAMVLPPLSLVSGAAVALTTLRGGPGAGAIVVVGSTAFVALMSWYSIGNVLPGLMLLGVMWLPLWILGWVLRESRSLAFTTLAAGLIGILGVFATYLILGDTAGWWQKILMTLAEPALQSGSPLSTDEVEQAMATMSKVMTGIAAAGVVLNSIMCLYLARGWQAQLFNPGGFRDEFYELRLGKSTALFSLAAIVLSMLSLGGLSLVATEVIIVALSLFAVQGFAIIHAVVAMKKLHIAWLVGLYVVSLFVLPQIMALIALMGLVDTWVDFRQRIGARQGTQ